jgi:hypothetical protein
VSDYLIDLISQGHKLIDTKKECKSIQVNHREMTRNVELPNNCSRLSSWLIVTVIIGFFLNPIQCRSNGTNDAPKGIDVSGYQVSHFAVLLLF